MKIRVDFLKGESNKLLRKILEDKRVLSNSMIYILEEYFPDLRVVYSDSIGLLEDADGNRYKVFCSSSGIFKVTQSCTKGVGRDDSFGNWCKFCDTHAINRMILVDTSKQELLIDVLGHCDEGVYELKSS